MCGIAGKVMSPASGAVDRGLVERMCAALAHRGPDARGLHVDGRAGLGIQRLRVVDLHTGDQPIYNEDRSVAVVLNGEIYNFASLRDELRGRGHRFSTEGDTETIVHLYEEFGPACADRLHGMFAFALWDARRRRLVIARDRVGKKPLFYCHGRSGLSFASELRSLMQDTTIARDVDPRAVDCFLAYGYVPAPASIFSAVRKLPPAHTLVLEGGRVTLQRYWRLDYSRKLRVADPRELHEPIRDAIRAATRRRLVADVPVGAFLSGGIDSSAVVAAMAQIAPGPVRTFSIGFDRARFDERVHARRVAELFGTEHEEFVVRPDALRILPRLVRHYGEPFADASAIPSFHLSEMTRRHVTVALNGDGGDESFGGYSRYATNRLAASFDRIPAPLRRVGAALGGRERGELSSASRRAQRLLTTLADDPPGRYGHYVAWLHDRRRRELYAPEFAAATATSPVAAIIAAPWRAASGADVIDTMLEVDVETYLPGDLLVKVDIATMAHGLEARSPLLDHELMELAAAIPARFKVHGREKKWILREALREWLPDDILDRPKQGFTPPVGQWLREELRDHSREILLDPIALDRGYFAPGAVRALLDRHQSGRSDEAKPLWALLMLELWHREFADQTVAPAGTEAAVAA